LELRNTCVIPRSLAEKIGGDVVGQTISCPSYSEEYKALIGGVYEDFPANSSIGSNPVYLSLSSIGNFFSDTREQWMGSDRYETFVKLAKGASPDELTEGIERMLNDNISEEIREIANFHIHLKPLAGMYTGQSSVKMTIRILTLLALIMLMSAGLNYLLVTIGQMEGRNKEMAVRKCYGTGNARIFARIMAESAAMLLMSLVLAVLLSFCFSDECTRLLGHSPAELYTTGRVMLVEGAVLLVLLLLTGAVPAWMYCRTPVVHAFRPSVSGRKVWKIVLLSLQFFASAMLLCLLVLVGRQYRMLTRTDMGFEYKNIATAYIGSLPMESRRALVQEIERQPGVSGVAHAYQDFARWAAGNNIWVGDEWTNTKNVNDLYHASANVFDVMGIKILRGETFRSDADSTVHQVIVEQKVVDLLGDYFHLDVEGDNVLGQRFSITEHSSLDGCQEFEICGVIENMRRGGFEHESADKRGAVIFPDTRRVMPRLYVRFDRLTPEALSGVQKIINEVAPTAEVYITPYEETVKAYLEPVKRFGTSVMIVGLVIFVIALIGLTGFVTDEVQRRAKEIAIRKVTGYSAASIIGLLCRETARVAVPSLVAGGALAMVIGRHWLSQFTEQVGLSPLSMILCLIVLLAVILLIVTLNCKKIASGNPVTYLRNE
ncbi:MAG: FtsX-like permease family protein, partial [Muribaculaceae bacterium]|nr:FtsX-like permease family protein [Muribaculaceae bacterium]